MNFRVINFSTITWVKSIIMASFKPLFVLLFVTLLCSCGASDEIKAYCQYPRSTITYTHQEIYEKAAGFIIEEVETKGSSLVLPNNGDIRALTDFMLDDPLCIYCGIKYSSWSDPPTIFVYLRYREKDFMASTKKIDDSKSVRVRVLINGCGELREIELPRGE